MVRPSNGDDCEPIERFRRPTARAGKLRRAEGERHQRRNAERPLRIRSAAAAACGFAMGEAEFHRRYDYGSIVDSAVRRRQLEPGPDRKWIDGCDCWVVEQHA